MSRWDVRAWPIWSSSRPRNEGPPMRAVTRVIGVGLLTALWGASLALAHEERLMRGRVHAVDLAKKLLMVQDAERARTARLIVDAEAEAQRGPPGVAVAPLEPGAAT